jgi:HEAT repeat protein
METPEVLYELLRALREWPWYERWLCVDLLGRMAERRGLKVPIAVDVLYKYISDDMPGLTDANQRDVHVDLDLLKLRRAAIVGLGRMGPAAAEQRVVKALIEHTRQEKSWWECGEQAREALSRIGPSSYMERIVSRQRDLLRNPEQDRQRVRERNVVFFWHRA